MKLQKGFTLIEGLLILTIVGLLGGIGWYVYSSNNKTQDTLTNADAANSSVVSRDKKSAEAEAEEKDPTADWKTYSSKEGKFTVKYPSTWVTGTNQQNCEGYLMLGPTNETTGKCQSEAAGQVSVTSSAGDRRAELKLKSEDYDNLTSTKVAVNNVEGERISGVSNISNEEYGGFGPTAGTKVVLYLFYTNDLTYSAQYQQHPTASDLLSDFDLMITKTLKFSS